MREVQIKTLPTCGNVKPHYYIREDGQLRNKKTGRNIKGSIGKGYRIARLSSVDNTSRDYRVHRLMALAFIPHYFEGAFVNHIDENPLNNSLSNLEWVTPRSNSTHGTSIQRSASKRKGQTLPKRFLQVNKSNKLGYVRLNKHYKELGLNIFKVNIFLGQIGYVKSLTLGYFQMGMDLVRVAIELGYLTFTSRAGETKYASLDRLVPLQDTLGGLSRRKRRVLAFNEADLHTAVDTYESVSGAGREQGVPYTTIKNMCVGLRKSPLNGMYFCYEGHEDEWRERVLNSSVYKIKKEGT